LGSVATSVSSPLKESKQQTLKVKPSYERPVGVAGTAGVVAVVKKEETALKRKKRERLR